MSDEGQEFEELVNRLGDDPPPDPDYRRRLRREVLEAFDARRLESNRRRRLIFPGLRGLAAALLVAVVAATTIMLISSEGAAITFEQVRKQIKSIRSMICIATAEITEDGKTTTIVTRCLIKDPGKMREEVISASPGSDLIPGMVRIRDHGAGGMLTLSPKDKRALLITGLSPTGRSETFLDLLKEMIDGADSELGEKTIDGQKAKGFLVKRSEQDKMEIWVDPVTAQPVRIEAEVLSAGMKVIMTDFVFDRPLDDSLFSLEHPSGYEVETYLLTGSEVSEKDLLNGLKHLAEMNDGVFPEAVYASQVSQERLRRYAETRGLSDKQVMELVETEMRMSTFLRNAHRWYYVGAGVKLAQRGVPVLWYQPRDSETYRLVLADLSVEDRREDQLPTR